MNANPQKLTAEELLRHSAWIRGLAASLVGDPAEADDLVQETWLAALRHPPARGGNPAAWLARVLKNCALQRRRSKGARALREFATARPERCAEAPDEVLGRFELQRELSELVAGLGEPYRTVVLLRYYEGLSGAEIARRLSLPAGTVRWRLKEGLERLRERLDERHGERGTWCALLAPLARPAAPLAPSTPGTLLTALKGVLIMKLAAKAAIVLPLLAAALVGLGQAGLMTMPWGGQGLPPEERVAVSPAAGPVAEEPGQESAPAEEPARAELVAPAETEDTFSLWDVLERTTVVARLLDEDGVPLPGVRCRPHVRLWPPDSSSVRGEGLPISGGDGRMRLEIGRGRDRRTLVSFKFFGPGLATHKHETVIEPGELNDLGDLHLSPGGALSGRVTDESGQPLEGVLVRTLEELPDAGDLERERRHQRRRIWKGSSVAGTNSQGCFLLEGVPVGFNHLVAERRGWLNTYSTAEVQAGQETAGVELVLEFPDARGLIEGVVVDPQGNPVPKALVRSSWGEIYSGTTTADLDGRFRLVLEDLTGPHDLRASAYLLREPVAGDLGTAVAEDVEPGTRDLVLQLGQPRSVELAVRTVDGSEPARLSVTYLRPDSRRRVPYPLELELKLEAGLARLYLPSEESLLEVEAEGYRVAKLGPLDPDALPERLECELVPLPSLRGRVLSGGEPLASARLHLMRPASRRTTFIGLPARLQTSVCAEGHGGAEGRFALNVDEPGPFVLLVEAPGHALLEYGPFNYNPRTGLAGLELSLGTGGAIEGRVQPAPGVSPAGIVVAVNRGDCRPHTQRIGPDGRFRFERLTPGPWQVTRVDEEVALDVTSWHYGKERTYKGGLAEPPADCQVVEGQTTRFDLDLASCERPVLRGRILVDDRAPAAWKASLVEIQPGAPQRLNSVVWCRNADGTYRLDTWPVRRSDRASCTVNPDGTFRLSPERPGTWRLMLETSGGSGPPLVLSEDLELEVQEREWRAKLETASLTIENVAPVATLWEVGKDLPTVLADALVWSKGGLTGVIHLVGDEQGRCHLDLVPAGRSRVARLPHRELLEGSTSPESWPTVLELELTPGEGGRVTLP